MTETTDEPECFLDINLSWYSPIKLNNAILEIDRHTNSDIKQEDGSFHKVEDCAFNPYSNTWEGATLKATTIA